MAENMVVGNIVSIASHPDFTCLSERQCVNEAARLAEILELFIQAHGLAKTMGIVAAVAQNAAEPRE